MAAEPLTKNPEPGTKTLNSWLLSARPRTLPAAIAPVALGSALAAHAQHFQINPALFCAGFALCGQIAANFANDYLDGRRGADAPGRLGPTRAVSSGLIAPRAMLLATLLALGLAAASGLGTLFYGGWELMIIGVASLAGALAYTPLAYYGLGEVFALVYFGFVAVLGTYYVETRDWPAPPVAWFAAAACGLLAANILLINNIRDRPTDALAGKRTLAVRFGRRFAQRFYAGNLILVIVITFLFFFVDWNLWIIPALATALPLGIFFIRVLAAIPDGDGPRFNHLLAQSAQFLALWAALLSLGIVMSAS